ncbi:MAG: hypothetical protein LC126_18610 [Bryobacterales bacterium]|nr:hypothetical protein [Bryobacterales bacterium]
MEKLNLVIAELQLAIAMVEANPQDPRLKKLFDDAISDLKAAAKSITGQDPGPPDT